MTGEITLRGRILPIGGLKEKILAAHRADIPEALIPKDNEKDVKEVPAEVLKRVSITFVEHMDEVLDHALLPQPSAEEGQERKGSQHQKGTEGAEPAEEDFPREEQVTLL